MERTPKSPRTSHRDTSKTSARSSARRREIARRAADLFDRVGYSRTSMDDIAEATGLRKPSLYHYFSAKDEILVSIHDEFVGELLTRAERRLGLPMSPEQRLLELAADILELASTHGTYARAYFANVRELPARAVDHVLDKRNQYQVLIQREFERGIQEGAFRDVDPFLASRAFFGMCIWSYYWHVSDWSQSAGARDIAYVLSDILLAGTRVRDNSSQVDARP